MNLKLLIYNNNNNYLIKVWTLQQRIFKYGNFFQNILGYSLSLLTFLTKTYQLTKIDRILAYLLKQIKKAHLSDHINIIVLSDHGMTTQLAPPIIVSNYVDANLIDFSKSIFSYVSNVYPKSDDNVLKLFVFFKKKIISI